MSVWLLAVRVMACNGKVPLVSPVASSFALMDLHLKMTEDFQGENATV